MRADQTAVTACPMCASSGRLFAEKHGSAYKRCARCKTIYADPRPSDAALLTRLDQFVSFVEEPGGWTRAAAAEAWKIALVRSAVQPPASLLDVGSGTGAFVAAAREAGYVAEGQDLAPAVATAASHAFQVPVFAGPLREMTGQFDLITMWDTLEHAVDPRRELEDCARLLAPGGHLIVMSPNGRGLSGRLLRGRWWVFGPTDHLVMFSPRALASALERAEFDVLTLVTRQLAPPFPPETIARHPRSMRVFSSLEKSARLQRLLVRWRLGDWIYAVARKRTAPKPNGKPARSS